MYDNIINLIDGTEGIEFSLFFLVFGVAFLMAGSKYFLYRRITQVCLQRGISLSFMES